MRYGFLIGLLLLLVSCSPKEDPFLGRWIVDKVNVDFDTEETTPEMVRQIGVMEKNNVVVISADSLLTLINEGDTVQYSCSLRGNQILCDGELWGSFEKSRIITKTSSPMGSVKVLYKKETQ